MVRVFANLGGAHSLLPENGGARSVELHAEVLQHKGSELSAWTLLFDITPVFWDASLQMLQLKWLRWEKVATVQKQEPRSRRGNFQVEKQEKGKPSHAAVIICLDVC